MSVADTILNGNSGAVATNEQITDLTGLLAKLEKSKMTVIENSCKDISFSEPILWRESDPIIFPNTINMVQGKSGVHKSRLVELIIATFLALSSCRLIGLRKNEARKYSVLYVDTERNLKEQFPFAVQEVKRLARFPKFQNLETLEPISLIDIPRGDRFKALKIYLDKVRETVKNHLVIILDVITDCVEDFNNPRKSMELIDLMNAMINEFDLTFICVIHENPNNSDKARGHLGTELFNKSSTVLQIGFEAKDSELIKITYKKTRKTKRLEPFHVVFSEKERTLVLADQIAIKEAIESRQDKARLTDVKLKLAEMLTEPMPKKALINELTKQLNCGERTIESRLKTLLKDNDIITERDGQNLVLERFKNGREAYFGLAPFIPAMEN